MHCEQPGPRGVFPPRGRHFPGAERQRGAGSAGPGLVNELLLDKNGQKMHKSKGNAVEPFTIIHNYGADTVRWYLPYVSPTWTPLKFDEEGLKEVFSKFMNPLKNTYNFFAMYANIDKIDIDNCDVKISDREEIDRWIISKYNSLLKYVTESYEEYDLNKVVKAVTNFVSDDLSNWYIRRTRNRFWASELDNSKKSVYITTYEVLTGLCKMIAPIVPYVTEEMYTKLTGKESVHLEDFPKYDESVIDKSLEEKMDLVRDFITMGRNIREAAKIKIKQPLSKVIIDSKYENIVGNLDSLILEELNVKNLEYTDNMNEYVNITYKPNFKEVGTVLGSKIKSFQNYLNNITEEDVDKLNKDELVVDLDGENIKITKDMVILFVSPKEGYNSSYLNNKVIVINTELTKDLLLEGLAREFNSKIQNMRKESGFELADRIKIYYESIPEIEEMLSKYSDYIKDETLCLELIKDDSGEEVKVGDLTLRIKLERVVK